MDSDFQSLVNNLEREILDLKTGHDKKSSMRTFTAQYSIPADISSYTTKTLRISYATSDQPLLIEAFGLYQEQLIFLEPQSDHIDAVLAEKGGVMVFASTFYFMANREITSITML